jgi:integrase
MPTFNYFVSAKKRNLASIYIRLSAGRKADLIVKSGLLVNPERWSNATQTIKQRILTEDDSRLINKLKGLRDHVEGELQVYTGVKSKEWLTGLVNKFHNKRDGDSKDLNGFIDNFLTEAEKGNRKGKGGKNIIPGTINGWKGFQRIFNEYQGIYKEDRIKEMEKLEKELRPRKIVDYEDITIDFYNSFVAFLSNEGYSINTMGRFVKALKYMMKKALNEKRHNNKEFQESAFSGFTEDVFTVYLTEAEVEKIYKCDLSKIPRMALARDAFIVLCETALRISDYSQIELNIRERNGKQLIYITQQKTGGQVIIPLTRRMNGILKKYDGKLPRIPEQHVNKYIKSVCMWCGITEELHWTAQKFGKKYTKTAKKYELISCHTGRRTACTLMYLAGIPTIDIMKISGHTSEGAFMRYIRVTAEETALRLTENPYFNGLKKVN